MKLLPFFKKKIDKQESVARIQSKFKGLKERKTGLLKKLKDIQKLKIEIQNQITHCGKATKNCSLKQLKKLKQELEKIKFIELYYTTYHKNDKTSFLKLCKQNKKYNLSIEGVFLNEYCKENIISKKQIKKEYNQDFNDFIDNLTALYYTDYSNEKYREQFQVFYFNILDIITNYYKNTKKIDDNTDDGLFMGKLFKKFFNNKKKDYCVIHNNKIDILDFMHSNASVKISSRFNFDNEVKSCLKSKRKFISGFIHLEDALEEDHAYHANIFIISLDENKIFRLEPNFFLEEKFKKQFKLDNLKLGIYPDLNFEDYINKVLYDYFEKNPLIINGKQIHFGGFFSSGLNTCPYHGGLCMFISVLQTYLKREVTTRDIRKYIIKFFQWIFHQIFKKIYVFKKRTIVNVIRFVKREYSSPESKIKMDNENYKPLKTVKNVLNFSKLSIKGLKMEEYPKNKLVFMNVTQQDLKEIY